MERRPVTVLMNPTAGSGTPADEIRDAFRAAGCDATVIELQPGQDPTAAAAERAAPGAVIVAAGGDGTVSAVAAGLVGTEALLGVLATGTLNHFAKDLGVPLALEAGVAAIVAGRVVKTDVGTVNGKVFLNACSMGVYPNIVAIRESRRAQGGRKWSSMAVGIARVLRNYRGVHVRLQDAHGRVARWRTPFLFIGNNEYTIEGLQLGSRARLDEGRLVAYLAPRTHVRDLPLLLAAGAARTGVEVGRVRDFLGARVVGRHALHPGAAGPRRRARRRDAALGVRRASRRAAGAVAGNDCLMRTLVHLSDLHFGRTEPRVIAALARAVDDLPPGCAGRVWRPDPARARGAVRRGARVSAAAAVSADCRARQPRRAALRPGDEVQLAPGGLHPPHHDATSNRCSRTTKWWWSASTARGRSFKRRPGQRRAGGRRSRRDSRRRANRRPRRGHAPPVRPAGRARRRTSLGRSRMAMEALARAGADVFLAGHLHVSHVGHTAAALPHRRPLGAGGAGRHHVHARARRAQHFQRAPALALDHHPRAAHLAIRRRRVPSLAGR